MRITSAGTGPADRSIGGKLAASATVFVGVIANSAGLELASRWVAAIVVATAFGTTAVAFFARLDNAIAALLAADGRDLPVVRETIGLDGVAADSAADVANRARTEVLNPLAS